MPLQWRNQIRQSLEEGAGKRGWVSEVNDPAHGGRNLPRDTRHLPRQDVQLIPRQLMTGLQRRLNDSPLAEECSASLSALSR